MIIIYITQLSGNMWAGPNNSVPAQILAQSKIDKVFWFNVNYVKKEQWESLPYFHNLADYPNKEISDFPKPYNKPDLVVFEGFYSHTFSKLVFEVLQKNIPYIIIPRCELTEKAQRQRFIKKKVGNLLFGNKFAKKAKAIQYLTEQEYIDSGDEWNKRHIIIPNGIHSKKTYYNEMISNKTQNGLRGVYIGRIEIYQKGLDMLIEACSELQDSLRNANVTLQLYGPDRENSKNKLNDLIKVANIDDIISINNGVFGNEKEQIQLDADFFIMTSRFEGHPMGLIEALSYGLPCVVTKGTNMTKEIAEADAGWVAESNVESIKNTLINFINERDLLQSKGMNSIKLSEKYNWNRLAEKSHESYIKLLKIGALS